VTWSGRKRQQRMSMLPSRGPVLAPALSEKAWPLFASSCISSRLNCSSRPRLGPSGHASQRDLRTLYRDKVHPLEPLDCIQAMPKNSAIPDAWDDDWESLADVYMSTVSSCPQGCSLTTVQKQDNSAAHQEPREEVKLSKAERKARHAELNKQIWESAYAHALSSCHTA
jgi:hypothetical protein